MSLFPRRSFVHSVSVLLSRADTPIWQIAISVLNHRWLGIAVHLSLLQPSVQRLFRFPKRNILRPDAETKLAEMMSSRLSLPFINVVTSLKRNSGKSLTISEFRKQFRPLIGSSNLC
jgi:hypothetical protein